MPALIYFGTGGALIFGYAKPVPFNPYNLRDQKYGAAKVAVAGPMANLFTALFFGLILRFGADGGVLTSLLAVIVQINLVLMIFNLIPIPPLDGSKVVTPFLSHNWQMRYFELERYGMIFVLLFVMFGFAFVAPVINFLFRLIVGS
jgi:Zn-dependent protease